MLVKLKTLRKARRRRKWDIERMKKNSIPFQKSVEDTIKSNSGRNVNERWIEFLKCHPEYCTKGNRLSEGEGKEAMENRRDDKQDERKKEMEQQKQ